MSIRQAMLAILEQGPMYGYQLRAEFEQRTGETWPLNIGQVYTTLTRLERDGLVEVVGHGGADEGDQDGRPSRRPATASTSATAPPRRDGARCRSGSPPRCLARQPARDELAIKLAIAVTLPGIDVGTIIQRQRSATMASLQDYTRLKRPAARPSRWSPPTSPGAWSSTRSSSTPRPRCGGSTTARRGCAAPRRSARSTP